MFSTISLVRKPRGNFGLVLFVAALAVTVIAAFIAEAASIGRAREHSALRLAVLADQIANRLDRGMFERYREFQLISVRPTLADPAVPLAEKQRLLEQIQQAHADYSWIGATSIEGTVLAAAHGLLVGADVSQRPWFANALQGKYVADVHEAKLLAAKLPNPGGEPLRFVHVAFPYRDAAGRIAGILGAHINWAWAEDVQRSVMSRSGAHGTTVFIVAHDGEVLLGPKGTVGASLELKPTGGDRFTIERWSEGSDYVLGTSRTRGFQSYPGLGWAVIVRQDASEALAPAKALRTQVLWGGLAIAGLCLAFGLAAGKPSLGSV